MTPLINGLHHVTAIAGDAQQNVDFYVGVLGLRMVKKTINYDEPGTYHLYYGDAGGNPGTILTFFPWPGATPGRRGAGETQATALIVPPGTLDKWEAHLRARNAPVGERETRFGQTYLPFSDPDGMGLELTEDTAPQSSHSDTALRRMAGVTLTLAGTTPTETLLTQTLGFMKTGEENGRTRLTSGASFVDLVALPDARRGHMGAGTVHHVAWRTPDDAAQTAWQDKLAQANSPTSPVMDRQYFHSIYFRVPGGVLFEIATDPPGFTADEPAETLGTRLCLPDWLEAQRDAIEAHLAPLHVPSQAVVA